MNALVFLLSLSPGLGLGLSVPSGETGRVSQIGYWAEVNAAQGLFSCRALAEDFRSRGEGFYHTTNLSLMGGVAFSTGSVFGLGFSMGPAFLLRTHGDGSEWGFGMVAQADGSVFYTGEKARIGLSGFTRAYPGTSSVLLSFGIGIVAGATPR